MKSEGKNIVARRFSRASPLARSVAPTPQFQQQQEGLTLNVVEEPWPAYHDAQVYGQHRLFLGDGVSPVATRYDLPFEGAVGDWDSQGWPMLAASPILSTSPKKAAASRKMEEIPRLSACQGPPP